MKNMLFCGYRDWAKKIYKRLGYDYENVVNLIYVTEDDDLYELVEKYKPEVIFFVGWSWIVKDDIIKNYECVCLHPSPLPKYRGGSPIQNQIINGELKSAVTLFLMDDGIDTGDIVYQKEISLLGNLYEIYNRIVLSGIVGMKELIDFKIKNNKKFTGKKQNENEASFYKRRKPNMSEINMKDFKLYTANELYNKVRSLQDPYPNAFVICKDDTKLYITNTKVDDEK